MKNRFLIGGLVVTLAGVLGANDVFQQMKFPKAEAGSAVVNAFVYGHVDYHRVRGVFKAAAPAARAAMTEQVLMWTKSYVSTPQFAQEYAKFRNESKPEGSASAASIDQELAEQRAQRKAEMEQMKKDIAAMPAEYRAAAEAGYKAAVEASKEYDTPEFRKMERETLIAERQADASDSEERIAEWERNWPADHRALVKRRLNEFLSATADVDYGAQLVNKGGKMRFANAAYEGKPNNWKLAYRAGKEPTEKARAFAKAWLAELK